LKAGKKVGTEAGRAYPGASKTWVKREALYGLAKDGLPWTFKATQEQ